MSDKLFDIEVLYDELWLDNVQDQVIDILGSDESTDICNAIAGLDYELTKVIRKLEKEANDEDWQA